jgi:hypothetical protein
VREISLLFWAVLGATLRHGSRHAGAPMPGVNSSRHAPQRDAELRKGHP